MRPLLGSASVVLALWVAGCPADEVVTEVVIVVDSELRDARFADELALEALPLSFTGTLTGLPEPIRIPLDGSTSWPLTHSVRRNGTASDAVVLILTALRDGTPVAHVRTVVAFRADESRGAVLHLPASCLGVTCIGILPGDVGCRGGGCVPIPVGDDEGFPWAGDVPRVELCNGVDDDGDGILDNGVDLSGPSGCMTCGPGCTDSVCTPAGCEATPVMQLAAGYLNTCARHGGGAVSCWGDGSAGLLGRPLVGSMSRPLAVPVGLATQVSVGTSHACALRADGRVACWGQNATGQLGDGSFEATLQPKEVQSLVDAVQVSAGGSHTCAIHGASREISCWGSNGTLQLGVPAPNVSATPVRITTLSGIADVSAGATHTCAIVSETVYCWGENGAGKAGGDPEEALDLPPTMIEGLAATQVAAGAEHSCAVTTAGGVACWGSNFSGALGITGDSNHRPLPVPSLSNAVAVRVSSGERFEVEPATCALLRDGSVQCWGSNFAGHLAQPIEALEESSQPQMIALMGPAQEVVVGGGHACARLADGATYCWGRYANGQLGDWSVTALDTSDPYSLLSPEPRRVMMP